ncbi:MAG: dynamin family protein [Acidimicrobiia bacterium]|nr:dynamin family protein [Acidimicrobiia bacterium]
MSALVSHVGALVDSAAAGADPATAEHLAAARRRLDEPLRLAIAGRVKAGKSTLLNALVGQELAPTDARECTRIVTWYRHGITYGVTLESTDGSVTQARFRREGGALEVDLDGRSPADVRRIVVAWPSRALETITLIDTPGIGSVNAEISDRTVSFLTDHDTPDEADAVVYLLRHLHGDDVRFLEAFHDDDLAHATPVNAVGVLSRADEVGVARLDALESAGRIAARYNEDPRVRRLCQLVVPVAGLVAQAGATLLEDEYRALGQIALLDDERRAALLLSVDRLVDDSLNGDPTPMVRTHLVDRLGLFGVRLGVELLRTGVATSATTLAHELVRRSGLDDLRSVLSSRFGHRSDVLKARSALGVLETVIAAGTVNDPAVVRSFEELVAGAHELAELRLLNALRSGAVPLRADDVAVAERLVSSDVAATRLGLAPDAAPAEVQAAAAAALGHWQRRAESPMATPEAVAAARVLARSCEGVLMSLAAGQQQQ